MKAVTIILKTTPRKVVIFLKEIMVFIGKGRFFKERRYSLRNIHELRFGRRSTCIVIEKAEILENVTDSDLVEVIRFDLTARNPEMLRICGHYSGESDDVLTRYLYLCLLSEIALRWPNCAKKVEKVLQEDDLTENYFKMYLENKPFDTLARTLPRAIKLTKSNMPELVSEKMPEDYKHMGYHFYWNQDFGNRRLYMGNIELIEISHDVTQVTKQRMVTGELVLVFEMVFSNWKRLMEVDNIIASAVRARGKIQSATDDQSVGRVGTGKPEKPKQKRGANLQTEHALSTLRDLRNDAILYNRPIPKRVTAMSIANITAKTWRKHDQELYAKWFDKSYR